MIYIILFCVVLGLSLVSCSDDIKIQETPSKVIYSELNTNIKKQWSSKNLSRADLAWHTVNSYGYECDEVVKVLQTKYKKKIQIICSNQITYDVVMRDSLHPIIRNSK